MLGRRRILVLLERLARQGEIQALQVQAIECRARAAFHLAGYALNRKPQELESAQAAARRSDQLMVQLQSETSGDLNPP